jgi:hypothetical protein
LAQEIEIIISIHKLYEQALRPDKIWWFNSSQN